MAIDAWRNIVSSAGDYYNYNLRMGVSVAGLCGQWRDELMELEQSFKKLEEQEQHADAKMITRKSLQFPVEPIATFDQLFQVNPGSGDSVEAGKQMQGDNFNLSRKIV